MNGTNGDHVELPASVRRQLGAFQKGLWMVESVMAVCGAVVGILAAFVALFVLDRFWDTPVCVRMVLAGMALALAVVWSVFWANRWGWCRRDARELARLVQRHHRKLGDRLLGIVELAAPETRPGNVSEQLCRAALVQVAKEAEALDFRAAVPTRGRRRWGVTSLSLVSLMVLVVGIWPQAGMNAWHRLLNPVTTVARYTFVQLQGMPGRKVVASGEPFVIGGQVAGASSWRPAKVSGRMGEQRSLEVDVRGGAFEFPFAGQTQPDVFTVKAGDARAKVVVEPVFRPELTELQALVALPSYLCAGVVTQDVRKGTMDVLVNSRVGFAGKISREVVSVSCGGGQAAVSGATFEYPAQTVKEVAAVRLEWVDAYGLRARDPFVVKVNVLEDEPPRVEIRGIGRTVALLEGETLEFEVAARDDFGVKRVGLKWAGSGNEQAAVPAARGEKELDGGGARCREVVRKVVFSPREWGLSPQRVDLRADTEDYLPGREPVESETYTILVLDRAEHAKMVQAEFERLAERLEELRRMEEALLERNEQLQEDVRRARDPKELAEKLAEQEQAERRNADQMMKLQEDLAKLTKEALRNQDFTEAVLAKWARLLDKLGQLAGQKMPKVAKSVNNAKESGSKQDQEGEMKDAVAMQEQVLKDISEALKQMNELGEEMQVGSFADRLRRMAELQKGVGEQMAKLFPDVVGAVVDQVPASMQIKMRRLGGEQAEVYRGVKTITDELGAFINRTRSEVHTRVRAEMVHLKVVEALERLSGLLESKVCQEGIAGAEKWGEKLAAWADILEPPKKGGGGGGGGGGDGQEMSPEMLEALMKLMRLRLAEEGVRNQTRILEARRDKDATYEKQARELAAAQEGLCKTVVEVGKVLVDDQDAMKVLKAVDVALEESADMLKKPQTDLEVIAAETEIIELLSQASDKACKKCSKGAASLMAMWEQMQRQMGMKPGKSGGGSLAGGLTERDNIPVAGDPGGDAAGRRKIDKAGGHDMGRIPLEFREAMESYFEKVERLE